MELNDWALARWLERHLPAEAVTVAAARRLGGGAIQENWRVDLEIVGGERHGRHALVLRTSAPSGVAVSWSREQEFAVLQVAHRAGVTVPEPWLCCAEPAVIGRPFYLMRWQPGDARGHKLVRDPAVLAAGDRLVAQLAQELAALHRVAPPVTGLGFMPEPQGSPAQARIAEYRAHLDGMDAVEPVLEWALTWLARAAPDWPQPCLIHGDFRTGNYLVVDGELSAVLDWEFAAFGDPREDLGWMLARYWRFGAYGREAGGIGSRAALLEGYEAASAAPLDRTAVGWWEVMATVRWAIIALMQAERHASGAEPSLELALTGLVLPQLELDLLARIAELEAGR